jgi:CheY-like chemotaxis protein
LQLILLHEVESGFKEHLDNAFSLCRGLLQILSDVLDFSKMETGSLPIVAEEFSLAGTAQAALVSFHEAAEEKNLSLRCDMDPALPEKLSGDAGRVRQLLLNLVGNAVKYTREGRVELDVVRVPTRDALTIRVLFVISDTGMGISPEGMANIFEPFQRGDEDYVLKQRGVGLGMPIVRRLVRLMRGELCVFSRAGQGTEIHMVLPFAPPAAEAAPANAADEEDTDWGDADFCAWRADAPRVLVVDDEGSNLMIVQLLLGILGYPTDVADSGPQALRMLRERSYALVFMDIQMPGMDGYEATAAIRAMPGLEALPIVALTAYAMRGDREKILSRGFDDYMAKPVMAGDLKKMVLRRLAGTGA